MSKGAPQMTAELPDPVEIVERTVGISLDLWYFPEWDQWKLSLSRNYHGHPILAVGPLRLRWHPVKIYRSKARA